MRLLGVVHPGRCGSPLVIVTQGKPNPIAVLVEILWTWGHRCQQETAQTAG